MSGKVAIVTGANTGIGFEVAKYLCEGGNDVVLACRSVEKGREAVRRIKEEHPNSLVQVMELNLSSTTSVREFVSEFTKKKNRLNLLVNNAGMALNFKDLTRKTTREGFEVTMATNHLGPFLLTNLLIDYIIQTGDIMGEARIVNVTCALHDQEHSWFSKECDFLRVDNFQLQKENTFTGLQAYKNSKLCNILFTYFLAEKLTKLDANVTVNAIDPGIVPNTELSRNADKSHKLLWACCIGRCCGKVTKKTKTPVKAGLLICDLADGEKYKGVTGKYYRDGREERSSIESYDGEIQEAVWKISNRMTQARSLTLANEDLEEISLNSHGSLDILK